MPLEGNSFMAMWMDIAPPYEERFLVSHTHEHLQERLSLPGFLLGRRFVNPDILVHRYFVLYEGENVDAFRSSEYIERLNRPSPHGVSSAIRNFKRGVCTVHASLGIGSGGVMATVRFSPLCPVNERDARTLAEKIWSARSVVGVHIGSVDGEASNIDTAERRLRASGATETFDSVLLIEGLAADALAQELPSFIALLEAAIPMSEISDPNVYSLSIQVSSGNYYSPLNEVKLASLGVKEIE